MANRDDQSGIMRDKVDAASPPLWALQNAAGTPRLLFLSIMRQSETRHWDTQMPETKACGPKSPGASQNQSRTTVTLSTTMSLPSLT